MALEIRKIEGEIILSSKKVNRLIERNVTVNNTTSCKITVPTTLKNKRVYVVWCEEDKNE